MKLIASFRKAVFFVIVGLFTCAGYSQNLNLAAQIGLFPTGTDANGNLLPGGVSDPHYTLALESAQPPYNQAIVLSFNNYWGDWAQSTTGKWLYTSDAADDGSRGWYIFRTFIDLTGLDPSSVRISGKWTCDNFGSILLNGMDTGNSLGNDTYYNLYDFSINSGFKSGINELAFRVYFPDGYDGLLVSQVSATAVPEPGSILISGIVIGYMLRRRRQVSPE
jgi:hypothetical protein